MILLDKIGDLLRARRCDSCGKTLWMHGCGSHILYRREDASLAVVCSRCPRPLGKGRLYMVDCEVGHLVPVNEDAYEFELMQAGKPGALYEYIWEVPELEDEEQMPSMRGQW